MRYDLRSLPIIIISDDIPLQAGFIDAFVLRNVMKRQTASLLAGCDRLNDSDTQIATLLSLPPIDPPPFPQGGPVHHISVKMGRAAAHIVTVLLAVLAVIGLLITATAMGWTQTAQLLCNTPTMIIEGEFIIINKQGSKQD